MTTTLKAYKAQPGSFVRAEIDGRSTVCLKAERLGRDFVNHYLVPLAPLPCPPERLGLRYVDPAAPVLACEEDFALHLDDATADECRVSDVLINARGPFLKVLDTAKTERHFAYVNIETGMVLNRQERGVVAVKRWRLVRSGG